MVSRIMFENNNNNPWFQETNCIIRKQEGLGDQLHNQKTRGTSDPLLLMGVLSSLFQTDLVN